MITKQHRMTRSQIGIIVLSAAVAAIYIAAPAQAALIEFEFGGTVTDVMGPVDPPWDVVQVGDPWSMTYIFDSTAPDTAPLATDYGSYQAITWYELTFQTAGGPLSESDTVSPSSTFIHVFNNRPSGWDQYEVFIPLQGSASWFMQLDDNTNTAWPTDALPLCGDLFENVDLVDFDRRDFILSSAPFEEIWGSIDYANCIPEPASIVYLTTIGLLGLFAYARRRRRKT
jgi:hypothetical protein